LNTRAFLTLMEYDDWTKAMDTLDARIASVLEEGEKILENIKTYSPPECHIPYAKMLRQLHGRTQITLAYSRDASCS